LYRQVNKRHFIVRNLLVRHVVFVHGKKKNLACATCRGWTADSFMTAVDSLPKTSVCGHLKIHGWIIMFSVKCPCFEGVFVSNFQTKPYSHRCRGPHITT
jgi:hypothetical protein